MQRNLSQLFLVFHLILLSSCSLFATKQNQSMPLLAPMPSAHAEIKKQKVTMSTNAKSQTFIVISHHDKSQYKALILTPTGQHLLNMEYDGVTFKENNATGLALPAQEIMAIMQFASWPADVVNSTYKEKEGWELLLQPKRRHLSRHNKPILEVLYGDDGSIDVAHTQQNYHVNIQPLENNQP